jgi:hypothetical protein
MTQIVQRALEPRVAPARIFRRHPGHRPTNLWQHARPAGATLRVRPLAGDELPVPAQHRVWRDDRRHLHQEPATKTGAEDSQARPFAVGQPHSLMSQPSLQNTRLFAQVRNDVVLFALEPAEEGRDEQLQRNHSAESAPNCSATFSALRSGIVGIRRKNHQLERAAVAESKGGEVTHVARRQTTDAERLGKGHDRAIDEAQVQIREASVDFHRA